VVVKPIPARVVELKVAVELIGVPGVYPGSIPNTGGVPPAEMAEGIPETLFVEKVFTVPLNDDGP
jgi:hypothetical protein